MRSTTRIALLLLLVAGTVSAQVKESLTVSYVEVPVTVVDRGGNPIKGLTKANFEIIDEGKKRDVAGFDSVDYSSLQSVKQVSPLNPVARRNFLIVFDLSFSSPSAATRAQEAARNFVTKLAGPQDRIGVATIDVAHGFRMLTSLTSDRKLVDAAIASPQYFRANDPLQLAGAAFDKETIVTLGGSVGTKGGDSAIKDIAKAMDQQQDQYNREKIDRELNLLSGLSKILRAVRGQKHILLLSEGFDPRLIQGRDAGVDQQQLDEQAAVETGQLWNIDMDNRYGSASSMSLLDRMAQIAKRSDVVIDTVDIRGIRSNVDARNGFQKQSNEGLHLLSNSTGGTVFQNSNDLARDFQRVIKTQEVVYVLAFQAPVTEPGKFHNLKVKLVNVPGGRAVARAGYYEAGGDSVAERTLGNAEIIVNDVAQDAVHMAALVAPFTTNSDNAQVPVILEVNGADIAAAAKGNAATVELFSYAFDSEGLVRDSLYERVALDLNKVGPELRGSGIKYYGTLSLPPGKYAVKNLVRVVESDKKGYARADIVVPGKDDVAVSQPFFPEEGKAWIMVKGSSHDKSNAPYPFQIGGQSFVPSASVRLKDGEARRFFVFVENASPDEMTLATNPQAKLVSQVRTTEGTKLVFELGKVAPAVSMLNVTVTKRGSDDSRSASVPITR
ncbi:MAG TPA: VWA domain-containing protein [Thermoanaerobaculia bacterium]|nr:VWA domain-containing protein [Thermoanaerobaculia bacterium]